MLQKKTLLPAPGPALIAALLLACSIRTYAAAPVDFSEVASIGDLAAEAIAQTETLEGYLKDEAAYATARKTKKISQASGVLACMAQAIAEHPARDEVQIAAADLRDAALKIGKAGTRNDAAEALAVARSALDGQASGEATAEHAWNKLIGMHAMMEEINGRNAKIRRAVKRLRKPETESLHATTLAVLAVAMHADTHEVKNESDVPQWQQYALEYQRHMTATAQAMKAKDAKAARAVWLQGVESCNACHDKFRED